MNGAQRELFLPQRAAEEILEERLAALVEEFNEPLTEPDRRVELHSEIVRLRRMRGKEAT